MKRIFKLKRLLQLRYQGFNKNERLAVIESEEEHENELVESKHSSILELFDDNSQEELSGVHDE